MKKRVFGIILLLVFLASAGYSPSIITASAAITGDTPPASGDWIINNPTTAKDEVIVLNGSLIINSNATFVNTTIIFNSTATTIYNLTVKNNGILNMNNCTIKAFNSSYPYFIRIYGTTTINNTIISNAGISGSTPAIYLLAGVTANIYNSIINSNYRAISMLSATVNIENVTINTADWGIYASSILGLKADGLIINSNGGGIRIVNTNTGFEIKNAKVTAYVSTYFVYVDDSDNGYIENLDGEGHLYIGYTNNITLENVRMTSTQLYPFEIEHSNKVDIINITTYNSPHGLKLYYPDNLFITDSNIYGLNYALEVNGGENVTIQNTQFTSDYSLIYLYNPVNITINNSNITTIVPGHNGNGLYITSPNSVYVNNTTITSQTGFNINGGGNVYIKNVSINAWTNGILLNSAENISITDSNIYSTDLGIYGSDLQNLNAENLLMNCTRGISIYHSRNINFNQLNLNGTTLGINYVNTTGTLKSLKINTTSADSIIIRETISVTIIDADLTSSSRVINIINSTYISIEHSTLYGKYGVYMTNVSHSIVYSTEIYPANESVVLDTCNNISVTFVNTQLGYNDAFRIIRTNNSLFNNNHISNFGGHGILVLANSTNNLFYENYFYNNNNGQEQVYDQNTGNHWDNGSVGNWYFNYDGYDADGDGIGDIPYNISGGSNKDNYPIVIDNDHDGLNDFSEIRIYGTDSTLNDTDHDGLTDGYELFVSHTDPNNNDTDSDGMPDGWEVQYNLNPSQNDASADPDNDGLTNLQEYQLGINPQSNDTDSDGMPDNWEVQYHFDPLNSTDATQDPDNDGLNNLGEFLHNGNPYDNDTDDDGMPDGWEVQYNLSLNNASDASEDPDNDGLTNLQEYHHDTNPLLNDTDNDEMPDGWEVQNNLNPLQDDAAGDADNDGLTNLNEFQHNTDPNNNDTDNDGMPDGWEVQYNLNPIQNDATADPDHDNLTNIQEFEQGTNPNVADTDSDGLSDGAEVIEYHTSPTNSDSDGDGLTDGEEITIGTDPNVADTDGDGIIDSQDALPIMNNYILIGIIVGIIIVAIIVIYFVKFKKPASTITAKTEEK